MFQKHHLDADEIDLAIMVSGDLLGVGGLPDADMAAALISANNDWLLEEWAIKDERLKLSLNVGPRDPALAVKEIERLGGHPSVIQVQIPEADVLLGNRHYYPIYEAAQELGLPIGFHGGGESAGVNPPMCSVGIPRIS
jgi:predicted TIM-barrel fold metal-dependent hydrolase